MRILTRGEVYLEKDKLKKDIREGCVFIYPTDTIYGIGCSATNELAVQRIRRIKDRPVQPFSIIAPGKEWIIENCKIIDQSWLDKLPGSYTFILKLKNKRAIAKLVNPDTETIGVRIPDHWMSQIVKELDLPIITTSVNKSGEQYMTSIEDIDPKIKNSVDYIIYEGVKTGKPSKIIDFGKEKPEIKER